MSKNLRRKTEGGHLEKENENTFFPGTETMCADI